LASWSSITSQNAGLFEGFRFTWGRWGQFIFQHGAKITKMQRAQRRGQRMATS
jgi:hypothetical protein